MKNLVKKKRITGEEKKNFHIFIFITSVWKKLIKLNIKLKLDAINAVLI